MTSEALTDIDRIPQTEHPRVVSLLVVGAYVVLPLYAVFSEAMQIRDPLWARLGLATLSLLFGSPVLLFLLRQSWRVYQTDTGATLVRYSHFGRIELKAVETVELAQSDLPLSIEGSSSRVVLLTAEGRHLSKRAIPIKTAKLLVDAVAKTTSARTESM